jgi:carbonic anhydrase
MRSERHRTAGGATGAPAGRGRPRTGDEALDALLAGNERFVRGRSRHEGTDSARRAEIASEQKPFAIILGCSDSRVPPELTFDTGLGDLFVVRVAGNTAQAPAIVGSIEYAAMHLGSVLLMVLGHQRCGAVGAAVAAVTEDAREPGSISDAVAPIVPVVGTVRDGSPSASSDALVERSVLANIEHTVSELNGQPLLSRQIERGELKVVGAEYRLDTGAVKVV